MVVERAVRLSIYGTPGAVYIDLPHDLLTATAGEDEIEYMQAVQPLPSLILPQETVFSACKILREAKNPLVIIGKGIAYGDAHEEMREFIDTSKL